MKFYIVLLHLLAFFAGCEIDLSDCPDGTCDQKQSGSVGAKPVEIPAAGIPRSLREWNWGGGSCVFASWVMVERRLNEMSLADYVRKTYSGGESYNGVTSKMKKLGVPYYASSGGGGQDVAVKSVILADWADQNLHEWYGTFRGDVDVLDRCTAERRAAVIFYYPNHSIMFCGFSGDLAYVMDNNRIESYIAIPKKEFIPNWRRYGGVAIVPTHSNPPPPIPYIAQK